MDQPNNNDERDAVVTVTVGEGPKALVDRAKTLRFVFHDFEGMKQERDEWVETPRLDAFGYLWGLNFYPKGSLDSNTDTDVSVHLKYMGDDNYTPSAQFTFRCKEYTKPFKTTLFRKKQLRGEQNYLKRKDVLENYLEDDGSCIIEVDLKITADSKLVWYPKIIHEEQSLKQSYLEASSSSNNPTEEESENNDTTDVVFVVDNDEFPAHKLVLSLHAKTLFALYKEHVGSSKTRKRNVTTGDDNDNDDDDDVDDRVRVIIPDMNIDSFKKCIEFIYTVNTTPNLVDAAAAIELLLAAHRVECVSLKLYVESVLVDKFVTPTNAASMLLLGDTYHCALLKEAALHSYISDPISFRESEDPTTGSWSKIEESSRLLKELLVYTSNKLLPSRNPTPAAIQESAGATSGTARPGTTTNTDAVVMNTMDVGTLREHLEEANLGLDGSREMLVTRLRNYRQTTVTRV